MLGDGVVPNQRFGSNRSVVALGQSGEDREVAGTAIECGMTTELQLELVTQRPVPGVHGVGKAAALALASPVLDLKVTQVANESWGVHALVATDAIS
jgi:acetamidase/formamidase